MKSKLCFIISLCVLVQCLLIDTYAKSYESAKEAIYDANDFIFQKTGYKDYYLLEIECKYKILTQSSDWECNCR